MKRKLVSMLLTLTMAVTAAGCGAVGEGQTKNSTEGTALGEEPVTLTMFIRNGSKYTGLQSDPVAKYVEEKLGIKIDLTVDSSLGGTTAQTSTFNELLAASLATGELADIIDFGSSSGNAEVVNSLNRAAEAGMIIPLDDLVAEHAPNISTDSRLTVRNEYRKNYMYEDGKFYSVGAWGGMGLDQLPGSANWVRWDLYKEMGYPEIKTDEEFLEMIKEMQEKYPETPTGEKIYGFGGAFADPQGMGDGALNRDYPLSKGYEPLEGNYAAYFSHADKEVVGALQDSESFFWNGVKFYFNANQMGLLDPGAVTMTSAEYTEKMNQGAYLATLNGWGAMNKEAMLEALGMPDAGFMPINMLDDVDSMSLYWESILGQNEFTISSKCKYPEKAVEFLDWCFSEEGSRIITQGAEGLAYTMEGDVPSVTEQYILDNTGGTVDMAEAYGKWKYAGINAFQHIDMDSNGYYIQPEQIPNLDIYSAVKKDALKYYGAESFNDYFTQYTKRNGEKMPNTIWGSYQSAIGAKPDDIRQKCSQINDYMYQMVFKLIYAADQEEYENLKAEAIAKVEKMGGNDVVEWYTNRVTEIKTDLEPLIEEAVKAYIK